MEIKANISMGRLIAHMALFIIVGMSLVACLWETLNDLLHPQADRTQLLDRRAGTAPLRRLALPACPPGTPLDGLKRTPMTAWPLAAVLHAILS